MKCQSESKIWLCFAYWFIKRRYGNNKRGGMEIIKE
jgi:hypothetical protein